MTGFQPGLTIACSTKFSNFTKETPNQLTYINDILVLNIKAFTELTNQIINWMFVYRFEFHAHFSIYSVSAQKQHRCSYYVSCAKITAAGFCHAGCYSLEDVCSCKGALRKTFKLILVKPSYLELTRKTNLSLKQPGFKIANSQWMQRKSLRKMFTV